MLRQVSNELKWNIIVVKIIRINYSLKRIASSKNQINNKRSTILEWIGIKAILQYWSSKGIDQINWWIIKKR